MPVYWELATNATTNGTATTTYTLEREWLWTASNTYVTTCYNHPSVDDWVWQENETYWSVRALEATALTSWEERHAGREKAEQQRRAAREKAERQANGLLCSLLSEEQLATLAEQEYFDVVSDVGKVWRIHVNRGIAGNVDALEDGRVVSRWCAHPPGDLPNSDVFLAQKLVLETDEAAFLRVANCHWRRSESREGHAPEDPTSTAA